MAVEQDGLCPRSFKCSQPVVSFDIGISPSYVSLASSVFACTGSLLLVGIYVAYKDLRKSTAQNIITQLAVADLANAVGIIIGAVNFLLHFNSREKDGSKSCQTFETFCVLQSYITQWAGVTSYIWTSLLAVFLTLRYICTARATHLFAKAMPLLTVISWLFPLLYLMPMLSLGKLGYSRYGASNWCYIKDSDYGNSLKSNWATTFLMIFADWLWQILSLMVVIVSFTAIYSYLYCHKRLQSESPLHLKVENIERRLLLIPIAYVVIHIWNSCQIVASFILSGKVGPTGCTQPYVRRIFLAFGILQGIGDAAQGWVNAILYKFASSQLRKHLFWDKIKRGPKTATSVQYDAANIMKGSSPFETKSPSLIPTGIGAASDD